MRTLIHAAAAIGLVAAIHAEEGFHIYEYPGYEGLPQIPGTEFTVHQKDRPQPPQVVPSKSGGNGEALPPSDAIVLFDGVSLERFQDTTWKVVDGVVVAGEKGLVTRDAYGDCQLHVEWRAPNPPEGAPSNMGNSGIFFMQRYELQVFDSYSCRIYSDGSAAAIYGQTPPTVNACRAPGEWQSFDVIFTAPEFDGDQLIKPARITVIHNGVVVHNGTEIKGPTRHRQSTPYAAHPERQPIAFQGHHSPVEYRNIWIRDLEPEEESE